MSGDFRIICRGPKPAPSSPHGIRKGAGNDYHNCISGGNDR
jgi:hypothetical protein